MPDTSQDSTHPVLRADDVDHLEWVQALRRSEEIYRRLARNLPNVAVFVFDHDLRLLVAEGGGLTKQGVEPDAVEGRSLRDVISDKSWARSRGSAGPPCRGSGGTRSTPRPPERAAS